MNTQHSEDVTQVTLHHAPATHTEPTRVRPSAYTLYWVNLNHAIFEVLDLGDTSNALRFINDWQQRIDEGAAPAFLEELIEEAAVQLDRQRVGDTWSWHVSA